MADSPTHVKPHVGRTFRVAVFLLASLLVAEAVSIGWSLANRAPLVNPVPESGGGGSADGEGAGALSEAELAAREAALVRAMPPRTGEERIGVAVPGQVPEEAVSLTDGWAGITDHAVRELMEVGKALRADGEMMGALEKFRDADARLPGNPRILYEIATAYAAMGLTDKAALSWKQIRDLGPEAAGDVYAIADLKLMGASEAPPMRPTTVLYVNQAMIKEHPEARNAEQVTIRLALKARDGVAIDENEVYIDARFYDSVSGGGVEPSPSNPIRWDWATRPVDWKDQVEEILDMVYFREEGAMAGSRRYYGFLVKLYYRDELQDIYSEPRTLVEEITRAGSAWPTGDSLFPED